MLLYSTKNENLKASLKEALFKGLPEDNGLYLPTEIPRFSHTDIQNFSKLSLQEQAFRVSKLLMEEDIPNNELGDIIESAINFDLPLLPLKDQFNVLELFHGPTLAFKDFGARFMARLMAYFLQNEDREINILVATSGDTGSAVANGFLGVDGIKVTILYPSGNVSHIQEKQLTTLGQNITALEVDGNFDDCQRLVKQAFLDPDLRQEQELTSANSINIARLVPQSFYYFFSVSRVINDGLPIAVCVPSGNFGNLCAGLIAKRMGLPIDHFIAATNANHVFYDYLKSGDFEPQPSVNTISNAMDVGNPSNFARVLSLYRHDLVSISSDISSSWYDDQQTRKAILSVYNNHQYLMCPHTAVGYLGLEDYLSTQKKLMNGIFFSTAHPAKFLDVIEPLINQKVEIPERLAQSLQAEKQSIEISDKFDDFKAFLRSA